MRLETIRCGNCRRPLIDVMVKDDPGQMLLKAKCGYADCLQESFPANYDSKVAVSPHVNGNPSDLDARPVTRLVGQSVDGGCVVFHTQPVGV